MALLLARTEPGIVKGFMGRRLPRCHRVDGNSKLQTTLAHQLGQGGVARRAHGVVAVPIPTAWLWSPPADELCLLNLTVLHQHNTHIIVAIQLEVGGGG